MQQNKTIKDIYSNIDLYGAKVFITALKDKFKSVCYADKSIPSPGSPTMESIFVREDLNVKKAIFHKNNEITVFFNCPQADGPDIGAVAKFF